MLLLALSTPGNATTATIAAVCLLLGVLLMARGRRLDAAPVAGAASPPPEAPAAPEPAPVEPAPADPAPDEPTTVMADEAAPEPQRIRLGGARFGETAAEGPEPAEAEPAPAVEPAPVSPDEVDEAPAAPRRIRLGGARFATKAPEPPAAPEPPDAPELAAPEPPAEPESPAAAEPPAAPEPLAAPEPPAPEPPEASAVEPAWKRFSRPPQEEAPAKPRRLRVGHRRFISETPAPPADPEPPAAQEPAETAPADAAPEPDAAPPDAPAIPPASGFRQGPIRLRDD